MCGEGRVCGEGGGERCLEGQSIYVLYYCSTNFTLTLTSVQELSPNDVSSDLMILIFQLPALNSYKLPLSVLIGNYSALSVVTHDTPTM